MSAKATLLPLSARRYNLKGKGDGVTCRKCRVPMKELKGHIFHKQRKWKCPKCARIRMQQQN